jgi:hypothetical protein
MSSSGLLYPPITDIDRRLLHVGFGPTADTPALGWWRAEAAKMSLANVKGGIPLQKAVMRYAKWTTINFPATAAQSGAP